MKTYNPNTHHRRSIRLKNYDYSQSGLYFITICTKNRLPLFGEIVGAGLEPAQDNKQNLMILNEYGQIIENTWFDLNNHVSNIKLYEFIIMPNHVHGIIEIVGAGLEPAFINTDYTGAGLEPAPTKTEKMKPISEIVRQFKTFSAKRINQLQNTPGVPVWQRNYYEHIIRNEQSYYSISQYIINNPINWQEDTYFI